METLPTITLDEALSQGRSSGIRPGTTAPNLDNVWWKDNPAYTPPHRLGSSADYRSMYLFANVLDYRPRPSVAL